MKQHPLIFSIIILLCSILRAADNPVSVFVGTMPTDGFYITGSAYVEAQGVLIYGGLGEAPGSDWAGKIVLLDRGVNSFVQKLNNVKSGGGIGAVVANNIGGSYTASLGTASNTIPGVTITREAGTLLKSKVGQMAKIGQTPIDVDPVPITSNPVLKVKNLLASYTLTKDDDWSMVTINSTENTTWTVPDDSVDLRVGARVLGANLGGGTVTITTMPDVMLIAPGGGAYKATEIGRSWEVIKVENKKWILRGNLEETAFTVTASPDRSFVLTATAKGAPPFTYQWKKDGVDISGQTQTALVLYGDTLKSGVYSATVTNATGSSVSGPYTLIVK